MNYPEIDPRNYARSSRRLRRLSRLLLLYASAAVIAVLVSGGIFTFTPFVGISVAHTAGTSMEPAYRQGDVVLVQDVDPASIRVGDVVVFQHQDIKVMHRVIRIDRDESGALVFTTQGDNVPVPDRPVAASSVEARLVGEIPLLGTISRLIDAKGGFYVYRSLVITVAASFVAVWGLTAAHTRSRPGLLKG